MVEYKKNDLMLFSDAVGHVAMATFVEKVSDEVFRVKNPLWLSMVPRQDKDVNVRISLETPAWAFRDFFADHNEEQIWDIRVEKFNFCNCTAFADIVKLHYYNSFSRIENGVKERVDANGAPLPKEPEKVTPPLAPAEEVKPEQQAAPTNP